MKTAAVGQCVVWIVRCTIALAAVGCTPKGSDRGSPTAVPPSAPGGSPVVSIPSASATPPPVPSGGASAEVAPSSTCSSAFECTIVLDECGKPYARRLDAASFPPAPNPCPPADHVSVEPACEEGQCVERVVEDAAWRVCDKTSDCTAIPWACGGYWAIARKEKARAEAHVGEMAAHRSCAAAEDQPVPSVACLMQTCVLRAHP